MRFGCFAFLSTFMVLAECCSAGVIHTDPAQAAALSAQSGRPVLAVGGNKGCPYCRKFGMALTTDPTVVPLANQFVLLKLDTESAGYPQWTQKFGSPGNGIPKWWIVRSDGETISSRTGLPGDIPAILKGGLTKSGTALTQQQYVTLTKAAQQLLRAKKSEDVPTMVKLVNDHAGSGSYAQTALLFDQAKTELIDAATTELNTAREQLTAEESRFEAIRKVVSIGATHGKLEGVGGEVDSTLRQVRTDYENGTALVAAAEQLQKGEDHRGERNYAAARKAFEEAITQNIPAATTLAQAALKDLPETNAMTTTTSKPTTAGNAKALKKAEAQVRLGKVMMSRNAEKAAKYFKQAIKLAPGSEAAREAETLLKRLQ